MIIVGETRHFFEIEIFGGDGEFIIDAVFEPIAFPAFVPTFNQEALNAKAEGSFNVIFGMLGGGTVAFARCPGPFADIHGPPNTDEF